MTRISIHPRHEDSLAEATATPGAAPVPPAQRDGSSCDLYAPGHQIHYAHQGAAFRSTGERVVEVDIDGTSVTLVLARGDELHWRHHDPHRLRRILELLRGSCVVHPEFHALRVGPYWFNCAGELDPWEQCPLATGPA